MLSVLKTDISRNFMMENISHTSSLRHNLLNKWKQRETESKQVSSVLRKSETAEGIEGWANRMRYIKKDG